MLEAVKEQELKLDDPQAGERSAPPNGAVASSPAVSRLAEIPSKRDLIDDALRTDASRSDREIARVIGCDHKTVGAARARLGIASPLGNSPPVDLAAATDKAMAMITSLAKPAPPVEPKYDPFDPKGEDMVIPHQPAIAVYENTAGAIVIIQCTSDPDEGDPIIMVRPEHVEKLIARLRKVAAEMRG